MRPGVIGCALSHLKLYKRLLHHDDSDTVDGYVIFEDDVTSNDNFIKQMKKDIHQSLENRGEKPDLIFFTTVQEVF